MLALAQQCAASDWPVHPLAPGRKVPVRNCPPCSAPGHTRHGCPCLGTGGWCHGFHAATTDPGLIRSWWTTAPTAGVGIACGSAGLVVIDIDTHPGIAPDRNRLLPGIPIDRNVDLTGLKNGFDTLALLAALRGAPDPAHDETTLRVRTPSGGLHIWYTVRDSPGWQCSSGSGTRRALAWQVDIRGIGGYIIAPGTRTGAGNYAPVGPCHTPAPLPPWIAQELQRTGHSPTHRTSLQHRTSLFPHTATLAPKAPALTQRVLRNLLADVASCAAAPEGASFSEKLNRAAFTAGGLIASGHLTHTEAHQLLLETAHQARPGQQSRSTRIIHNGLTAGTLRPFSPGGHR
ncbi:bifunctional DNA primase/polymerase [Streptomyces luteireticuli]|uniref:bifunctional DNA primase/polymerase n=1 Tax=Streptomyces luteireticuli TaxID=173858 RepID=UPI0035573C01